MIQVYHAVTAVRYEKDGPINLLWQRDLTAVSIQHAKEKAIRSLQGQDIAEIGETNIIRLNINLPQTDVF
jgi:hypothetical protein